MFLHRHVSGVNYAVDLGCVFDPVIVDFTYQLFELGPDGETKLELLLDGTIWATCSQ